MFYVYEYYKKDDGEVFYVGKGTRNRYRETHNRNDYFNAVMSKYECDVRIIAEGLTNDEACSLEIEKIAAYKENGEAYCNFTEGGTGFSTGELNPIHDRIASGEVKLFGEEGFGRFYGKANGFYGKAHSEETRRRISESRKGKGARFGKDNPMYGKGMSGESNPMFGKTGLAHPGANVYRITYSDGTTDKLTYKQCERKFGIAFTRVSKSGGVLHYKKKSKNDIYEGTLVERVTTSRKA